MKPSDLIERRIEDAAREMRRRGAPFAVATVVRTLNATSAKPGSKAILLADGAVAEGWIGGACARAAVARAAREALTDGTPRLISLRPEDLLAAEGVAPGDERDGVRYARNGCPSEGTMDIFVEPVSPSPALTVIGAGPVAAALGDLARGFDYRLTVAPDAAALSHADFVVIATQGDGDAAALSAALKAKAVHIAFVGSARKFAAVAARLGQDGADMSALAAVSAPAGLDIAAITPEEIALSILAEITQVRRAAQRAT
ncbi:MAG: XdhC family protein [Pseudomonadota bacterium]